MGFALSQRILLICLIHFSTSAVGETVNQETLMSIVKRFQRELGGIGQYAVAFRITADECLKGTSFPSQNLLTKVKEQLELNEVYKSDDLIAAKADKDTHNHSEFRLKNYLKSILNQPNECVVYFTLNSPCLNTCLSESGKYSVKGSLKLLEKYVGIKALAFKNIWKYDEKENVINRLKTIAPDLLYYQCETNKPGCDRL